MREWRAVALTIGLAALIAILYSVAWLTFAVLVVTVFLLRWTLVKVRATARLIAWLPISVYDFVAKWLE